MNHDPLYQRWLETGWRRPLSESEAADMRDWLEAHPQVRPEWEIEEQLNRALLDLRDVPVASNFTARVLQAVESDASRRGGWRVAAWRLRWRSLGWTPKVAVVVAVFGFGVLSVRHSQVQTRQQVARGIARLADVQQRPSPDILLDYDAIRASAKAPPPDQELLTLLK